MRGLMDWLLHRKGRAVRSDGSADSDGQQPITPQEKASVERKLRKQDQTLEYLRDSLEVVKRQRPAGGSTRQ